MFGFIGKTWFEIQHLRWKLRMRSLMKRGLKVGRNTEIQPHAYLDEGQPYLISIGNHCAICEYVRILAHDATVYKYLDGLTRMGKVDIKDNVFIGEYSVILPGVTIGPNALVTAGSVVNKDVPPNSCVCGVPARFYGKLDDLIERNKAQAEEGEIFTFNDIVFNENEQSRKKVVDALNRGPAFVQGFTGKKPYCISPEEPEQRAASQE